ncbi:MAG: 1,4-dihydroxy-2-naphthoate octaprenyltransferase [Deltaproteobacteria bacterium]|nr:1,4-dihydroxy-2-naphthoate octaprenyltransferase [Deltaproteobacteria bacterium]MBW2306565.1 1,4-dihydroxy-2-naphthoate octaprenyltransferase [Deltaproteobacteria bacterium]
MNPIRYWVRATRAPFLQAALIPVLVGTAVAYEEGFFHLWLFILAAVANMAVNAGTNLVNDYYDHLSGTDAANIHPTPFSGGSRMIQEGKIKPDVVLRAAWVCFGLAVGIGLYLAACSGWPLIVIGAVGLSCAFAYTAFPFKIGYRGYGEVMVGILLGPLSVLGTYFVQAGRFSWNAFWASIPVGILVASILYVNEFPDYQADRKVGKNHLIVLLGPERAARGYPLLMAAIYLSISLPILAGILPWLAVLSIGTLPVAWRAARVVLRFYSDPVRIIPAQAATIMLHGIVGLILSVSFLAHRLGL